MGTIRIVGPLLMAASVFVGQAAVEGKPQQAASSPKAAKTESEQKKYSDEVNPTLYKALTDAGLKPEQLIRHVKELYPLDDGMKVLEKKNWAKGYKGNPYRDKDYIRYSLIRTRTIEIKGEKYEDIVKQLYFRSLPKSKIYSPDEVLFFGIDHERFKLDREGKRLKNPVIWHEQMIIADEKGKITFNSGLADQIEDRTGH